MEGLLGLIINFLSIMTICICSFIKLPQIWKILQLKSSKGLSMLGFLLELTSYTVMTCYNFTNGYALLSYLEYPVILVQQLVLIYLVLMYRNQINRKTITIACGYFALGTCALLQILPKSFITFMAPLSTPISASSKIVQLCAIITAKNAESVALATWFISAFTNFTRIITVWLDSKDPILLGNFMISVSLSSSVLLTAMYYKKHPKQE